MRLFIALLLSLCSAASAAIEHRILSAYGPRALYRGIRPDGATQGGYGNFHQFEAYWTNSAPVTFDLTSQRFIMDCTNGCPTLVDGLTIWVTADPGGHLPSPLPWMRYPGGNTGQAITIKQSSNTDHSFRVSSQLTDSIAPFAVVPGAEVTDAGSNLVASMKYSQPDGAHHLWLVSITDGSGNPLPTGLDCGQNAPYTNWMMTRQRTATLAGTTGKIVFNSDEPMFMQCQATPAVNPGTITVKVTYTLNDGTGNHAITFDLDIKDVVPLVEKRPSTFPPLDATNRRNFELAMQAGADIFCDPKQTGFETFSITSSTSTEPLGIWYYDGAWTLFRIADWLKNDYYNQCGFNIARQWRDYVNGRMPSGNIAQWRYYFDGAKWAYYKTNDPSYVSYRNFYAVAAGGTGASYKEDAHIRELSFGLESLIGRFELDGVLDTRIYEMADLLIGFDELYNVEGDKGILQQVFMTGVHTRALQRYYNFSVRQGRPDRRMPVAIKRIIDRLYASAWNQDPAKPNSLQYTYHPYGDQCGFLPAPDASGNPSCGFSWQDRTWIGFVIPAFAWMWQYTGDVTYLNRGDEMFSHILWFIRPTSVNTATSTFTLAGHTLVNGQKLRANIFSSSVATGTLPGGLDNASPYWVINANQAAGTFQIAATSSSSTPVTLTTAGSGWWIFTHYDDLNQTMMDKPKTWHQNISRGIMYIDLREGRKRSW